MKEEDIRFAVKELIETDLSLDAFCSRLGWRGLCAIKNLCLAILHGKNTENNEAVLIFARRELGLYVAC